nr:unnamed protein product [Digitaria exilis]
MRERRQEMASSKRSSSRVAALPRRLRRRLPRRFDLHRRPWVLLLHLATLHRRWSSSTALGLTGAGAPPPRRPRLGVGSREAAWGHEQGRAAEGVERPPGDESREGRRREQRDRLGEIQR